MKSSFLIISMCLLTTLFIGCKKSNTGTGMASGKIVFDQDPSGRPFDSTVYIITGGELNVYGNGVYATTATTANTSLNISILGHIVNGTNALGGANGLLVTITTSNGQQVTDYNNVYGNIKLNGTTLTFNLSVSSTGGNIVYNVTGNLIY